MNLRGTIKQIVPADLFKVVEPYGHFAEAFLAQVRFNFPAKNLKVIGVTGTDGKTSTVSLITQMLRQNGYKVAMMTTISIDYGDGNGEQPNPSRMTTMGAMDLVQKLAKIKASGAEWLVLETTSHALAQFRVWGVPYDIAVMTNISHEHLDYHGTFERYRDAKKRLFTQTNANKKGKRVGIINAEDPSAELFIVAVENSITYGVGKGDLRATKIVMSPQGSQYVAVTGDNTYDIECHIPGSFNVYNSLATVAVGIAIGMSKLEIEQGVASLKSVEGRMTSVNEGQNFGVIVDYAHTPESFEKIFKEVRPLVKGKLTVVFGSAGRRDETKRSKQGAVAGKYCDVVIATEEDNRDCDGDEILQQIASGAQEAGKVINRNLFLIPKREDAVAYAIKNSDKGDMVLLLGKGHEKSILTNGPKAREHRHLVQDDNDQDRVIKIPYDEVLVARDVLRHL
ncbi:MAG: UDP-N-acetylmuramoyl-L-alanyl-D-glutamate--2,6-diaminopimelate ligase [Candidatus Saccharimonadales bacterium]